MIKKSLEEKIKDVVFWTFTFFILYTIVGFLLETNWLKTVITLRKVNEILKDSLTITAAFLAPVAAFVLFSDWRKEHVEVVLDTVARKIRVDIEDLKNLIYRAHYLEAIEIDEEKNKFTLIKHSSKGSILDMRLELMSNLKVLKKYSSINPAIVHKLNEFIDMTVDLENTINLCKYLEKTISENKKNGESEQSLNMKQFKDSLIKSNSVFLQQIIRIDEVILEIDKLLEELILH